MNTMEKKSLEENNNEFKFCFLLLGIMVVTVAIIIENTVKLLVAALPSMAWISIMNQDYVLTVLENCVYKGVIYMGIVLFLFIVLLLSSVVSFKLINRVSPCNLLKGEQL